MSSLRALLLSYLPSSGDIQVAILAVFGRLPLGFGRMLGKLIGSLLYYTSNYNTRTTIANIRHCYPELTSEAQDRLIKSSLQHTGMLSFEMAMIWHKPYHWLEEKIVSVKGFDSYERALAKGRGVMLLAPHLGNWEVIGQYVSTKYPLMNMYEPPKTPELDKLMSASRNKTGGLVAPANQRGLVMLLKHLKAGHSVGILPDQVPEDRERSGVIAPFFGQPACTMTLVSQMIRKTDCSVIMVVAWRVAGGFEILFSDVSEPIGNDDSLTATIALNMAVERQVRQAPEQYQWEYKRFKGVKRQKSIYQL